MSHFHLFVLVPKSGFTPKDPTDKGKWSVAGKKYVKDYLEAQMERYSEHREVPEHDEDCSCVGWDAKMAARREANGVLSIEEAREIHAKRRETELPEVHAEVEKEGHGFNLSTDHDYADDQLWQTVLKPRLEAEKTFCEAHPLHNKPDPDCEDCKGTGTCRTTSNPEGKWDWCRPGGRWACAIQKKEYKSTDNGFNFTDDCEALHLNTMTTEGLLKNWEPTDAPLAILTPDGEWHERGEMGMFGMFRCEPHEPGQWRDAAKKLLEMNPNCIAVGVDCHT